MAVHGKNQRLKYKRRRTGETDYRRRLKLLRGEMPRAVVRVSNTRVVAQIVNYESDGDRIAVQANSSELTSMGWPKGASLKSVPSAYLTGFSLGKRALSAGIDEAVLDIGLAASSRGSRVFSALKGMIDAGLWIPHNEEVLPSDDRINGAHIDDSMAASVESTRSKIEGASS
ncbi:MAG: 50S ribosomal protein L18 [Candidatus Thalassarchaeaceae archaeon]|nr:50S ribosomal protein L18 [Candidatus Thalassarchaeaceae archaeon]|tara:strand:+ start:642 stop:1157 length:516 start_codon:yes stop_codon:yes gene_type:complete